jgi:hypothetical protein
MGDWKRRPEWVETGALVFNPDIGMTKGYRLVPGIVACPCGRNLEIDPRDFTTTCECGADFNGSGDRLAPREQWGEETGEHWMDAYRPEGEDV